MPIMGNEKFSQAVTIAADGIHAVSATANTYLTAAADLKTFRKLFFLLDLGVMAGTSTVAFSLVAAKTSTGQYAAITGAAIVTITQAAGGGSQYAVVAVSAETVQSLLGTGYEFVKGQIIVSAAATVLGCHVLGAKAGWEPTSGNADAVLVQTVEI